MLFFRKRGIARTPIKHTATQPLTDLPFPPGAGQHQTPSRTASLNSQDPILRPCASCGGSGPMTFIKRFKNTLFATHTFITRSHRQLAATLVLLTGAFFTTGVVAGEPNELEQPTPIQEIALQMPSQVSEPPPIPQSLLKSLEHRRLLRAEKEIKIQAQTQYLAAKFSQSESTIREYVELAWKEASKRSGMSPELLIAMMQNESSLRPKVQSSYGAQGLMQVVRRWHHDKLQPSESLFDPEVNIRVGADVLAEYLEKADGSLNKALKKYSGNAQGYATRVLNESYKLAHVAAVAAGQVLASKG